MSWRKITCKESDLLHRQHDLEVAAGFTDMDGEHGDPQIIREWSDWASGELVVKDIRFPHPREVEQTYLRRYKMAPARKPCEHYAFDAVS